jgi:3',5'-cyclic AMP phosphodiesterase CpdA
MFVLAQLTDLHMAATPQLSELASKRVLGFINWQRKRKYVHRPEVLDAITRDVKQQAADHIAVTGDLTNLALRAEYKRARTWLDALGAARDVTVIPGNHDVYVPAAVPSPGAYWSEYMRGDDGSSGLPFVRKRGNLALIALSTGVPTGPFMATGRLGQQQLSGLAEALAQTRSLFRLVLIHHPPLSPPQRHMRRLVDAADLRQVLAQHGAELLIHGHDHERAVVQLDGPGGTKIPAVGAPSASANAPHGHENAGGYNIYRIDGDTGARLCELVARERGPDGRIREIARQTLI